MTMTQVLYALTVAEQHNFSHAAELLFVSQPALSQQIKNLERELGYDLFRRTARGVEVTPAGAAFCAEAQQAANAWRQLEKQVSGQSSHARRRLRIGMGSRVYSNDLFEDVARFFDLHPEIEVTFVTEAGGDFLAALDDGSLDLALDRMPPWDLLPSSRRFSSYSLIRERQCILMAPEDPRRKLAQVSFSEFQGCTMLSGVEGSLEDRIMRRVCQEYGIAPRRIYRSDGIETIIRLVRSGKGVALGPQSFSPYYGVAAVPLIPASSVDLKFICLSRDARRPELLLLRDYLTKICRERGF